MQSKQGFTLIEVLVSITLLAILIIVITAPITGLFGMTRNSSNRLDATGDAQQALEYIQSEWADTTKYNATCTNSTLDVSSYGVVTVQGINYNGDVVGPVEFRNTCTGSSSNSTVPIKRVTVTSTVQSSSASLTIDLARPQ